MNHIGKWGLQVVEVIRHRNMAVFIDLENLFGGYGRDVIGVPLADLVRGIRDEVVRLGVSNGAASIRAYANWAHQGMSTYRREMVENGVEPVQVWSYAGASGRAGESRGKNAADIQLVVDALTIVGEAPWIDVFVIVSGDGDFVPLVRRLQFLGKFVVGATIPRAQAGGVNGNLRAAVDHYVDFHVGDNLAAPPLTGTSLDVEGGVRVSSMSSNFTQPRSAQEIVVSDRTPSVQEYVDSALAFTREYTQVMKGTDVDGSQLYPLLRRQWPRVTFSTFGFKTFGAFITEACSLPIYHPANGRGATGGIASTLTGRDGNLVFDKKSYLAAVQELFMPGAALYSKVQESGPEGCDVLDLESDIVTSLPHTRLADIGFPDILALLQVALPATAFVLVKEAGTARVTHRDQAGAREHYPQLSDPGYLRVALEDVLPSVSYPELDSLVEVLMEITLQMKPLTPNALLDAVGDALPKISAGQIRIALSLLYTVGAFSEDPDAGTITLSSDVTSVEDGVNLVVQDAVRRAENLNWVTSTDAIREALFSGGSERA